MGLFDGISSAFSSAASSVSRAVSSAFSSGSRAVSSAVSSGSRAVSSAMSSWSGSAQRQTSAANNANAINNLAGMNLVRSGSNTATSAANSKSQASADPLAGIGAALGGVGAALGGLASGATSLLEGAAKNAATAATLPVTLPLIVASAGANFAKGLSGAVNGSGNSGSVAVNSPDDLKKLDYSNPDVEFFDPITGASRGYLGQHATPYAVTDDLVLFNTGKGQGYDINTESSWTNTPDSQKLHDYGLTGNYAVTSRDLDATEQAKLLETYKAKGWIRESKTTVTERVSNVLAQQQGTTPTRSPVNSSSGGNLFENLGATLGSIFSGSSTPVAATAANTSPFAGNPVSTGIDTALNAKNKIIAEGIYEAAINGNVVGGAVKAIPAAAVDIVAPLDLINVTNKLVTGRGGELSSDEVLLGLLDAGLIVGGIFTGGTVYLGGKALKAAAKIGGKTGVTMMKTTGTTAKYGSYVGQAGMMADASIQIADVLKTGV